MRRQMIRNGTGIVERSQKGGIELASRLETPPLDEVPIRFAFISNSNL